MFIHVVAQLLAAAAILSALFGLSLITAALLAAILVALAVVAGGMHSAGPFGLAKLALLYLIMLVAGWLALRQSGGVAALLDTFPAYPWFSLFGYGVGAGLNDLLSMLVGVLSTQTYLQAIFAARDRRAARGGALLSAVLIPPLGLLGIAVGLHMRQIAPEMASVQALPVFIQSYFSPALAGLAFAALLIAAVGTAAGLTLGVVTTLSSDILARWLRRVPTISSLRWLALAILLLALLLTTANLGSAIMSWSFLSMGLRGATLALPLLAAVYLGVKTPRRAGALAIILAPLAVLWTGITGWPDWPPLYPGLVVAATIMLTGFWRDRRTACR
jgi:solute:Na+ symporter, SSS family